MAKLAFLAVTKNMEKAAARYLEKHPEFDVALRYYPASQCEKAVAFLKEVGAQFVITRGTLAKELRRIAPQLYIIEVVITAQEMGLLMKTAKQHVARRRPRIAVIGSKNMFCDMQDFNEIFDIDLRFYGVESTDQLVNHVMRAKEDHTDLVIGGDIVCKQAAAQGMLYLRQPDGRDSIAQAFQTAARVIQAAENESKNTQELKALLDYTSFGIVKVGIDGSIEMLNQRSVSYLEPLANEPLGKNIYAIFQNHCNCTAIRELLAQSQSSFFTAWLSPEISLAVSIDPMMVDGRLVGSFWAIHEIDTLKQLELQARTSLFQSSSLANTQSWLSEILHENQAILHTAAKYAQYGDRILLSGSHQLERELLARYIHESSLYASSEFCYLYAEEALHAPALTEPQEGMRTIFIDHIDALSSDAQRKLLHLLLQGDISGEQNRKSSRLLLFGASQSLDDLVQLGRFSSGLYHMISALTIRMPVLKNCPIEIFNWFKFYISRFDASSAEQFYTTKAAKSAIVSHPWLGGLAELRSFCQKVAMNVSNYYLDEPTALHLLSECSLCYAASAQNESNLPLGEREQLQQLIEKYDGNRTQIANELHISLTTLWRRLKKNGFIE